MCTRETYCGSKPEGRTMSLLFTVEPSSGALAKLLQLVEPYSSSLLHVESRTAEKADGSLDVCLRCTPKDESNWSNGLQHQLQGNGAINVRILPEESSDTSTNTVPWFPRRASDLDLMMSEIYDFTTDPDAAKLPEFQDDAYQKRRKFISEQASKYRHGQPIIPIDYNEEETQTWRTVFREVTKLYPTHACRQHNKAFNLMKSSCGYSEDKIPDLEGASKFLQERTGFRLRPVAGQLTPRDFLSTLAFRVFCCTQYIRHSSNPLYTPEPDVCHEILGHVPMLSDPAFAEFTQEIGLACLGAPDEFIEKLSTLYWFTIEFGICKEAGEMKAYGAGLLSSFGEMKHAIESSEVQRFPFHPPTITEQKYSLVGYQNTYFYPESFEDAVKRVRQYVASIPKPFHCRYNPYTEGLEVMSNREGVTRSLCEIETELERLKKLVGKLEVQ
ncbi:tryptophan 5-hydroxylase 1-like [Corticium candelabrum]|uniref:tryptophan 5-hydroxylase 1-like n=1 Tax=Corticium candelabrum TaxID=121492 RepID=UPI002E269F66|nr:tryptophan 5-hydroxylase 1-like [Corticium candelabrum]XP_062510837.1 tryptophan 5-hydroxylase 1-like [Corticium candelabrum]